MAMTLQQLQQGLDGLNAERRRLEEELETIKEQIATQKGAILYRQQLDQEEQAAAQKRKEEQKEKTERVQEVVKGAELTNRNGNVEEVVEVETTPRVAEAETEAEG